MLPQALCVLTLLSQAVILKNRLLLLSSSSQIIHKGEVNLPKPTAGLPQICPALRLHVPEVGCVCGAMQTHLKFYEFFFAIFKNPIVCFPSVNFEDDNIFLQYQKAGCA